MSLRYALLGLLEDGPASGYALNLRFERSLRRFAWSAGQNHIYPELKRLADDGLITVLEEGPRGRRTYQITTKGRKDLRDWLVTPPKPRAVRDERVLRMSLISALDSDDARAVATQHLESADQLAAELEALAKAADADPHPRGRLRFGRLAIEYGIYQARAQQQWAHWALEQLEDSESSAELAGIDAIER